jgi:type I restriction enzyme, S subunit
MIRPGWTEHTIADIAAEPRWSLNGGPFGSKLVSSMYASEGIPVIRGTNLPEDKRFDDSGYVFVSPEKARELRQHEARSGDIIITQRGTLGQVGLIPENSKFMIYIISQSQMKLTVNQEKTDPLFVYYCFRNQKTVQKIIDISMSSGVPHINLALLRSFPILLPPLPTQRRIASILGAYDDLIEVNRRRIAVLEEMARRLFDEWFVHFRFPGHEAHKIVETEHGPLPEGWRILPLIEICHRITDGSHHSPPSVEEGMPMASVKDMHAWGFDFSAMRQICREDFDQLIRSGCKPEIGDILIAKDGANLNKHTFLVSEPLEIVLLSSIAIIQPKAELQREFMVSLLRSEQISSAIKLMKSGAAIPRIVLKDFKRLLIPLPSAEVRDRYEKYVAPVHGLIRDLAKSNETLAASRDLLLPRLISGDLTLPEAERELEVAA